MPRHEIAIGVDDSPAEARILDTDHQISVFALKVSNPGSLTETGHPQDCFALVHSVKDDFVGSASHAHRTSATCRKRSEPLREGVELVAKLKIGFNPVTREGGCSIHINDCRLTVHDKEINRSEIELEPPPDIINFLWRAFDEVDVIQ
jgi:hypothetical protein